MKTLTLDIENVKKPKDVVDFLNDKDMKEGDELRVMSLSEKDIGLLAMFLTLLAAGLFVYWEGKREKRVKEGEDILKKIFSEDLTIEQIEEEIGKEYNISVKVNTESQLKELIKEDPIDALFGIWRDTDITLEKIRAKAWPKRK